MCRLKLPPDPIAIARFRGAGWQRRRAEPDCAQIRGAWRVAGGTERSGRRARLVAGGGSGSTVVSATARSGPQIAGFGVDAPPRTPSEIMSVNGNREDGACGETSVAQQSALWRILNCKGNLVIQRHYV